MLPFPMFSVVGVRADGQRRVLAIDLTPYRQADETRKTMLGSLDYSGFQTIVVEADPPHRDDMFPSRPRL